MDTLAIRNRPPQSSLRIFIDSETTRQIYEAVRDCFRSQTKVRISYLNLITLIHHELNL